MVSPHAPELRGPVVDYRRGGLASGALAARQRADGTYDTKRAFWLESLVAIVVARWQRTHSERLVPSETDLLVIIEKRVPMAWLHKDIVSVAQFERADLEALFALSDACRPIAAGKRSCELLRGKLLGNLFFEPSTRTRLSFAAAFRRLGGAVETTEGMTNNSMAKGESLEDAIAVVDGYFDALVIRHPQIGSAQRAADVARVPVLNAGDGAGEHPTQALLDVYTIMRERGRVDGLTIALVGDLKHGRTVHSLARLLSRFDKVRLLLTSPPDLSMPSHVLSVLDAAGVAYECLESLADAVEVADVVYVTRLQAERFDDPSEADRFLGSYVVNRSLLERVNALETTILHPLPRLGELSTDVDDLPGAAFMRQAHNGVPVRMALFCSVFGVDVRE
ncbi:MAG: aspartate carbamoyltransferase catalytic subunit [Bradymonadia bacterium]